MTAGSITGPAATHGASNGLRSSDLPELEVAGILTNGCAQVRQSRKQCNHGNKRAMAA